MRHSRNPATRGLPSTASGRLRGTQEVAAPTPLTPTSHTGECPGPQLEPRAHPSHPSRQGFLLGVTSGGASSEQGLGWELCLLGVPVWPSSSSRGWTGQGAVSHSWHTHPPTSLHPHFLLLPDSIPAEPWVACPWNTRTGVPLEGPAAGLGANCWAARGAVLAGAPPCGSVSRAGAGWPAPGRAEDKLWVELREPHSHLSLQLTPLLGPCPAWKGSGK